MTNPVLAAFGRPFRLGIVGGAPPSMIGPVHRVAAAMDQRFTLVAGVLSSRPERSRAEGMAIGLPGERCYGSIEELIATQRQLLYDVSHEVRSPLARLNVALDLARERKGEDSTFEHMQQDLDRLDQTMERDDSVEADQGPDLRVCVSRGQRSDGRHARWDPRLGTGRCGRREERVEVEAGADPHASGPEEDKNT